MHLEPVSFAFFHANMQYGFSLLIQLKLSFEVISWCLGYSSGFSRCMTTFLWISLIFKTRVKTNTNLIFVFVLKPWFFKNPCKNMGSCIVFGEKKGNTPNNSWCNSFVSKGCAHLGVLFELNKKKMKVHHEHKKTDDLIKKEWLIWQRKSCGIMNQVADKTKIGWNMTKSK